MSTLDQMQAFVAVVEEGSFTAASLRFDISPTAMSKKISMLEKSLNVRLLIRTPRLITMTDIGKKYYTQCKRVLHEYKLSNLLIEDKDNNLNGTLNIVCMREIASNHFDIAIGYENSDVFNDWCSRKVDKLLLYYPNIKPAPLKIKAYIDYLAHYWKERLFVLTS